MEDNQSDFGDLQLYKDIYSFVKLLNISSEKGKEVLAKDLSGDPTSFKQTIIINVEVFMEGNLKNNFQVIESFNYKNTANKFDLKRYEKEIINNLTETSVEKLIFKLSNIK